MQSVLAILLIGLLGASCGDGGSGAGGSGVAPTPSVTTTPASAIVPTPTATATPATAPIAWAAGSNRLLRADDGGFTWAPEPVVNVGDSVVFVDRNVGWVAGSTGSGGQLLHTTDGGRTWTREAIDVGMPPPFFFDVDALDHEHAVVGGAVNRYVGPSFHHGPPAIFFTSNAGTTWQHAELVGVDPLAYGEVAITSLCLTDGGHGVAVGSAIGFVPSSVVLVTHDAGVSWRETTRPFRAFALAKTACAGDRDLWLAGGPFLFHSPDAGDTWTARSSIVPDGVYLAAIEFQSAAEGWALGWRQSRLVPMHTVDAGAHWIVHEITPSTGLIEVTAGLSFRGTNGVIVLQDLHPLQIPRSSFGVAFATRDGGATWTETVFPEPINALWDVTLVP